MSVVGIVVGDRKVVMELFDRRLWPYIRHVGAHHSTEMLGHSRDVPWAVARPEDGDVPQDLSTLLRARHGEPVSIGRIRELAEAEARKDGWSRTLEAVKVDEMPDGAVLIRTPQGNLVLPRGVAVALRCHLVNWGGTL